MSIELNDYEMNFNFLFNEVEDYAFIIDENGSVIKANNTAILKLGYSSSEFEGLSFLLLYPPEFRNEALCIMNRISEGKISECEIPLYTKNHLRISVKSKLFKSTWSSNKVIIMFCKRKLQNLIKTQKEYAEKITGYNQGEIMGRSWDIFCIDSYKSEGSSCVGNEIKPCTSKPSIIRIKQGKERYAIKNIEEELIRKEKILEAVALSTKELLENRNYYKAIDRCLELLGRATQVDRVNIFQNNYDESGKDTTSMIGEWCSEGNENQLYNLELKNIPVERLSDFIDEMREGRAYRGLISEVKNVFFRKRLETYNIKSMIITPIFVSGLFWGFVGFDECKSERIWSEAEYSTLMVFTSSLERAIERSLIEEELTKSKKAAETANILKSQFLANMSHEIRTPMNGILGFLDLLSKSDLSSEQKQFVAESKAASEVLLYLINDILDLSKIEAGKLSMEKINFNIRTAVEDAVSILIPKAYEKSLEIHVFINSNVPEEVIGDPARLRQILNNLVGNAVKFTEEGEISIAVEAFEEDNETVRVRFEVSDTGVGIAEKDIAKLFKPFIQADASTTRKYGGTGLGLAITKELVKLMDGDIAVESIKDKGSKFYFTAKFKIFNIGNNENNNNVVTMTQYSNKETKKGLNPRILLVEDNEMNRKVAIMMLQQMKMNCDIAVDGYEAVKVCSQKEYDIIFMDCQMPILDGYGSTKKIRELEMGKKHTPIIAMTANAMEGDKEKCFASGMDDYISKPINYDSILKVIEKYIIISPKRYEEKCLFKESMNIFISQTGFSEKEVKELYKIYIDSLAEVIKEIESAIRLEDYTKVSNIAHQLKGSSANLRISGLVDLSTELQISSNKRNKELSLITLNKIKNTMLSYSLLEL